MELRKEIESLSFELGVHEAFIEKDYVVTRLLERLVQADLTMPLIFSGGTSLAKAHRLVHRFSEDIDFRVRLPPDFEKLSGGQRRVRLRPLKRAVDRTVTAMGLTLAKPILARDCNTFQQFHYHYPTQFGASPSLRPYIKIDVQAEPCRLDPITCYVSAMTDEAFAPHRLFETECTQPIEIAVEKVSALSWRLLPRDDAEPGAVPDLCRHVHDLAAMREIIAGYADFTALASPVLYADRNRGGGRTGALEERLADALSVLTADGGQMRADFQRFVGHLTYGDDPVCRDFDKAVAEVAVIFRRVLADSGAQP